MAGGSDLPAGRPPARRPRRRRPPARARTGSSGQPIVTARRAAATGPAPRARTRRPRPWRSEPSKLDCRRPVSADPRAGSGSATRSAAMRRSTARDRRAGRPARAAHGGAEVEQALVPGPCLAGRQGHVGQRPGPRPPAASGRASGPACAPTLVSTTAASASNANASTARAVYGPTPGSRWSSGRVAGTRPPKSPFTTAAAARQAQRPPVVAQAAPAPHHLARRRRGARRRGREPGKEPRSGRTTRATWVWWSITSDTRTAHGSRVRRHGSSRRWAAPQARTARRSARRAPPALSPRRPARRTAARRGGACSARQTITLRRKKQTSWPSWLKRLRLHGDDAAVVAATATVARR